jgi:hypothetical protein
MRDFKREMEELRPVEGRRGPLPFRKLARLMADMLDRAASSWAFKLFEDKEFRKLAKFEEISRLERDRIFNELVLANLTLIMLTLEARDIGLTSREPGLRDYYALMQEEIPTAHLRQLSEHGIEPKYLKDWKKLIRMRFEEYGEDRLKARSAAMEVEARELNRDLTAADMDKIHLGLPLNTVAIGAFVHICRGKTNGRDDLLKLMVRMLGQFYVEFRVTLEGYRITPFMRANMGFRRLWRKLIKS